MGKTAKNSCRTFFVWILLLFSATTIQAQKSDALNIPIEIKKNKGAVYELLKEVSNQSGYLFIYDSQLIDNDKKIKIDKGRYSLEEAIYTITENNKLNIHIQGSHILLKLPEQKINTPAKPEKEINTETTHMLSVEGILYDRITDDPIVYGSVGVNGTSLGTVSNQDGEFKLVIPDSLKQLLIRFSHIGYESQTIEASLLAGQQIRLYLEPNVVPLQEIVVRIVDPLDVIHRMIESKDRNYPDKPMYITTFYREGINHRKKNVDLTEAVLKIYKTEYKNSVDFDQAKLIKMRRIVNRRESDTLFAKMKSGISSSLRLDIMKKLPDFLDPLNESHYVFTHTDISMVDDRRVNVISFEPKPYIKEPFYKGKLYIDAESLALLEARFEINPEYVEQATSLFVQKKSPLMKLTLEEAKYSVSYKRSDDGFYYINHIRGDIVFKAKKKRRLFSTPLHCWFEMVSCKTETENVKSFSRSERLLPHKIFSETKYSYDKNFWGNFNVILPEEKLKELIVNNLNEVVTD